MNENERLEKAISNQSVDGGEADDKIIAVAFKRSLWVFLILGIVILGVWLVQQGSHNQSVQTQSATMIDPQPVKITAEKSPPIVKFTDITVNSGISHVHTNGAYGERLLPETMGGGVAVLDFNNDGSVDLLFVNGRSWPWRESDENVKLDENQSSLVLYQGDGAGNFIDVTSQVALDRDLYGMGAAVGDYDGDGDTDIFVSAVGRNHLFENINGQRFQEVGVASGVAGAQESWSTGATFTDYDRDGDLDLMVLNYVRWSREIDLQADYQLTGIGRAYGPPAQFAGTNSYLYRNDGEGQFSDVSVEAGIQVSNPATGLPAGKGLSVLPTDANDDGWVDLLVANDMVRNFLFMNNKGQGFEEQGVESGIAFDNTGSATGAMGIDGAVINRAQERAIAIGNFGNEMTSLYVGDADTTLFTDQAVVSGVGPASRRAVTFGLFFFDYDLDGRIDLLQANGHIENDINIVEPGQHYAQAPQLFWNCGLECPRQFMPVELLDDNGLSQPIVGRAAAYADIDRDGDLDVILTQIGKAPKLLRNDQSLEHNWLQFYLRNQAGASAVGASLELTAGEVSQYARVEPTRSYLTQVETVLTLGIGDLTSVDSVVITWPDGRQQIITDPKINIRHVIDDTQDASNGSLPNSLD